MQMILGSRVATAIGHWSADPKGSINEVLAESWRQAFFSAPRSTMPSARSSASTWLVKYWLTTAISLSEWLVLALSHRNSSFGNLLNLAQEAVLGMNSRQRRSVLKALPVDSNRSFNYIVQVLVGEDLNLYRELLDSPQLTKYHLAPLATMPGQPWAMKAILALETQTIRSTSS